MRPGGLPEIAQFRRKNVDHVIDLAGRNVSTQDGEDCAHDPFWLPQFGIAAEIVRDAFEKRLLMPDLPGFGRRE